MKGPLFHQRAQLVAFFGLWSSDPRRSNFGAQIERLALKYTGSKTCTYCRGTGFVISNPKLRRKGAKRPVNDRARAFFEHIGLDPDTLAPQSDAFCPKCWGKGVVQRASKYRPRGPVTARPTGSSRTTERGGYTLDENSIPLCGAVGRWLGQVYARDPIARRTIEVYFEQGQTLVPLWLCSEAGLTLLHRSVLGRWALDDKDLRSALWALDNERAAERDKPDPQRGALIRAADREAATMLRRAADVWNEFVPTDTKEAEQDFKRAVGL